MIRKLLTITAFSIVGSIAADAQQTPTAPKDKAEIRIQMGGLIPAFEGSYLGVQTQEITKENYSRFGLASVRGVGIEKVVENSPADKAGLQTNDVVIRFDGEEVQSIMKLSRLIAEVAPDHTAKLTVLRGGGEIEINVTMGKREFSPFQDGARFRNLATMPNIQMMPGTPLPPMRSLPPMRDGDNVFVWRGGASRQIGVGVTPLTKQLGDNFGIAEGNGLLIESVRDNSPAAKAGLKVGDIIVEADGKAVKGQMDLIRVLSEKKEGDVSLTVIRDRNRQTVRVTPEISNDGRMTPQEFENLIQTIPAPSNFQKRTPEPQITPRPATVIRTVPRIL